ncbi:hypothetical protein [Haloarchaeobius litoreus]|uniref:Uncharacterized protein n=1 Tax=Haloarchaeobius litoreus TaxID=755306 RepID=A0ABD6DHW9_9EURY|nr:hypothetical protein [Haloarchaeobius litoreus]
MRRRRVLRLAGLATATGVAGCSELSGGSGSDTASGIARRPDDDAPPRAVLPSPEGGLEIVGLRTTGGAVGANAGQLATYEADDGTTFEIAALRMETESDATALASRIRDQGRFYGMDVAVRHGVFVVAGGTDDADARDRLLTLLSYSEAVNRAFIAEHDLLGGAGNG